MNIEQINKEYYTEDKLKDALEAERISYIAGNSELTECYALIVELLQFKLEQEELSES
jgi:hypothetical protein